jgi:hypothetical protein
MQPQSTSIPSLFIDEFMQTQPSYFRQIDQLINSTIGSLSTSIILEQLLQLEQLCESRVDYIAASSSLSQPICTYNLSLQQAIRQPTLVCQRTQASVL